MSILLACQFFSCSLDQYHPTPTNKNHHFVFLDCRCALINCILAAGYAVTEVSSKIKIALTDTFKPFLILEFFIILKFQLIIFEISQPYEPVIKHLLYVKVHFIDNNKFDCSVRYHNILQTCFNLI